MRILLWYIVCSLEYMVYGIWFPELPRALEPLIKESTLKAYWGFLDDLKHIPKFRASGSSGKPAVRAFLSYTCT